MQKNSYTVVYAILRFIIQFSNEEGVNWIFDVDFKATYLTLASENFLPIMNNKLQIVQL